MALPKATWLTSSLSLVVKVTSQSLVFVHKCNFYQGIVDDLATTMTLTGQEARIQVRFHLPDHPQAELYEQLCQEYKNLSAK